MRLVIMLLLGCTLLGQSSGSGQCSDDVSASPRPASAWIIPSDHPDLKIIMRVDGLPDFYKFEFWNGGDATVITKEQLLKTIDLVTRETNQSPERFCTSDAQGRILNYPCRIKPALSAARTKR